MTLPPPSDDDEIAAIRERLIALNSERTALEGRLAGLLTLQMQRACANEWVPRLCGKPKVKCGDCPNRNFLPVTDTVIAQHLSRRRGGRTGLHHWRLSHAG